MPLKFQIPAGFVVTVTGCALAAATLPGGLPCVAAMAVVVGAFGLWSPGLTAASVTALMAWCFTTGFLVNDLGVLTFSPADLLRLGIFLAMATAGGAVGALSSGRWKVPARQPTRRTPMFRRPAHSQRP